MKYLFSLGLSILSIGGTVNASPDSAINAQTDQLIIKYKSPAKNITALTSQLNHLIKRQYQLKEMAGSAYIIKLSKQPSLSAQSLNTLLTRLNQMPTVLYALKDRIGYIKPLVDKAASLPIKPTLEHELQWDEFKAPAGVRLESAPGKKDGAWQYSVGQAEQPVVVAVLDTGIELNERLTSSLLYNAKQNVIGWNFSANNNQLADETGSYHGTHVAGTIAANGRDLQGMGPKLKILPIKIPNSSGMFYESAVINGIHWALGHNVPGVPKNPYPASVMNMSFGIDIGPGQEAEHCDIATQEAIDAAKKDGAVIVVAAGNNNMSDDLGTPAGCQGTVRVTSTGPSGLRAYYSNYGPGSTYAAPGGDKSYGIYGGILSTVKPGTGINGSGLSYMQGTSMASPHVAGVAGLLFAYGQSRAITGKQVEQLLYASTHDFGASHDPDDDCVTNKVCGHGIIDAKNALAALQANYDVLISAPSIQVSQMDCNKGMVRAAQKNLQTIYGQWVLKNNSCVQTPTRQLAKIQIKKGRFIEASLGDIVYRLESSWSSCTKIGVDGAGCYR